MPSFPSPEPKVSCFDDLDFFKDFMNEFMAIVYNDALMSKSDFLTEPTLSPQHIDEFDLKDETSFSEYNEVEQNILNFNDLFPFNIIYPDDLKLDKDNDDNEIDIIQSSGDSVEGYTEEIVHDFKQRLETIFGRSVNRVHVLDFEGLTPDMRQDLAKRVGMVYTRDDGIGDEMGLDAAGTLCFQLGGARSSMTWRHFILAIGLHTVEEMAEDEFEAYWLGSERVIHVKGDLNDYWIEISSDREFLRDAPSYTYIRDPLRRMCHRLISYNISGRGQAPEKYLFRHAEGRKSDARLSVIDMGELVKLNICMEVGDDWTWVAQGAERQPIATAAAPGGAEDASDVDEARLEEDVHEIQVSLGEQREVVDAMARDFSNLPCGTRLADLAGKEIDKVVKYRSSGILCEILVIQALRRIYNIHSASNIAGGLSVRTVSAVCPISIENILKSIDEGSFKMGKFRETLAEGEEGALHLGPEQDRVLADLSPKEKDRFKADIRVKNILLQGLPKDIYTLINHYTDAKDIWENVKMLQEGSDLTKDDLKLNRGLKESNYDKLYAYLKQHEAHANENKMILERYNQHAIGPLALVSNSYKTHLPQTNNQLRTSSNTRNQATVHNGMVVVQNVQGRQNRGQGNYAKGAVAARNGGVQNRVGNANPGQARQIKCLYVSIIGHIARNCTQPNRPQNSEYFKDKMLLMQAQVNGAVLDEEQILFIAGGQTSTFDDDVDEEPVQDLALNEDNVFQADQSDPIYDEAGPSYDSDILSEVQDHDNYIDSIGEYHDVHEMQNDVQPNYIVDSDAEYTSDSNMIPYEQYVKDNAHSNTVNASLTTELARYKEQVELYERRARFELSERRQKIDEQLRIIITDCNIKEESLKKELHSVKMQLNSTIGHNKSMREEVTTLKKDFKQKEKNYLEDFLDMKALKEKVEDKLFKQDQSLQTIHMLCQPKPYYDEKNEVAIGYKNPFYLLKAMRVQSALYNGHEIVKTHQSPAIVHDSEDTLEIVETTRMKIMKNEKTSML
ncbi:hypothetical protein Tco_0009284 [Tanacetum coccineum]